MATYYPKTVDTTVTRSTRPVFEPSLENAMFLCPTNLSTEDTESFTSLESVVDFGFAVGSEFYEFAKGCFGGKQAPTFVKLKPMALTNSLIEVSTTNIPPVNYEVSINVVMNEEAKTISYTVQPNDGAGEIATGLQAALSAEYDNGTDTSFPSFQVANTVNITITPSLTDPYGMSFGVADSNDYFALSNITPETYAAVAAEAKEDDEDWYFLSADTHDKNDQDALFGYAQAANQVFYVTTSQDPDNVVADAGAITEIAFEKSYAQGLVGYFKRSDAEYPEGAIIGSWAKKSPSKRFTLNLQTFEGITPWTGSELREAARIILLGYNGNFYAPEKKRNGFKAGVSPSGDFADTVRFSDWLQLATETALFGYMTGRADISSAIGYEDPEIRAMEQVIWNDVINPASLGTDGSILRGSTTNEFGDVIDLEPVVNFGNRADKPTNDIANRLLEDCTVEVVYAGAIHAVKINAYVVLNRLPS